MSALRSRTRRTSRPSTPGRATGRGRALPLAVLAVALATASTALTGCGGGSGGGSASGPLKVWVRGAGDSQKAYQMVFDAYTKQSGVKIQLFMTNTDFETKLNAAAAAHKLPDVVIDDGAQLGAFKSQGIITEVDKSKISGASQVSDTAWKSVADDKGATYGVPFSAQASVLLVRSDWLKKVGMQPPKTWADLEKVAEAFTTQDPDGDGKKDTYGLDLPGSTQRGYLSWYWSNFLYQAGGDFLRPTTGGGFTSTISSPQAVQAAEFLKKLYCTDKVVQPGALNNLTTDTNTAFQTGVAGLYFTGPYAYATMDATAVKGKYAVVVPPAGPKGVGSLAEGTTVYAMAGSHHAADFDSLASYMVSAQAQKTGMTGVPTATIVRLPINTTVDPAAVHGNDPRWQTAQQVYADSSTYEPVSAPDWQTYRNDASENLNKLLSGCGDAAKSLDSLNSQFQSLLKK
ncbi:carbohydrate ABC transporter substrate-binding protein, CUT1 family [Streptomyces sp. DvalAA-14]|uniref:ABC transporter substrate-binding protein n=1 Tax=unclassified Streptomyces TaxID=2593676 RepID=UPI00081B516A|nr:MULTISPECIES: sugar ABC transporter substrate-binding protein [unclassified Streptomyces]MYS21373.1 extracellular solute-binding protein [Streptomyces sp. SID4948]SCD90924.1 carbohydrate ABC transporter substrate-binding protein, CUT1 family [Streptomyces sp. DvalAA-14]